MGYGLKSNEQIAEGLQRIAAEQVEGAVGELEDGGDPHEAVHEARKSCKKVRAVLRLARDAMGGKAYRRENRRYRDAARRISELRDSQALLETMDAFESWLPLETGDLLTLREALCARRDAMLEDAQRRDLQAAVAADLKEGLAAIPDWPIPDGGFGIVADGLERVYARGRKGLKTCRKKPSNENLHDWRKRAKYLRYQVRILRPAWPKAMKVYQSALHELSDRLGDDHDLAVFEAWVLGPDTVHPDSSAARQLRAAIGERRARAQAAAWPLAQRIYAEKPDEFVRRLGRYWAADALNGS
ncbi:MAG: CHAD domain-containing protein [Gammaproteobacteria bacterium]